MEAAQEAKESIRETRRRAETVDEMWSLWREEGKALFEANCRLGLLSWREARLCPACRGSLHVFIQDGTPGLPQVTSYACPCNRAWHFRLEVERLLPPVLRKFTLKHLKPHPLSTLGAPAEQQAEIDFLRAHRNDGFVFLGPPGSSKSTFAAALLVEAIAKDAMGPMESRKYVWRIDGREFFEREHEWVTASDKTEVKRLITAADIRRARLHRFRPVLALEEVDKRRMTEFNADALFSIVNAMDENDGQLIMTTNLTVDGFSKLFSTSESESVRACGDALCRRLFKCEEKGRYVRNYWK